MSFKVKYIPEDFCVNEVLGQTCFNLYEQQEYSMYFLEKKGFTTFQAIEYIADFFHINSELIGYAGLKDEDGITQQYITIPLGKSDYIPYFMRENDHFISLRHVGYCDKPIQVGKLIGNSFRLILRNVDPKFFSYFSLQKKYHLVFPNYYDTQRFGISNDIKNTHIIGKYLFLGEYEKAMSELLKTKTDESRLAQKSECNSDFFLNLDSRKLNFYLNSFMSSVFNERLMSYLSSDIECENIVLDGIRYIYPHTKRRLYRLMEEHEWLEINRCIVKDTIVTKPSLRASVASTIVNINNWLPDVYHPNKYAVEVSFFLPSGTYATLAMRQMEYFWKNELEAGSDR